MGKKISELQDKVNLSGNEKIPFNAIYQRKQ